MRSFLMCATLAVSLAACDRSVPTDPAVEEIPAPESSEFPWRVGGGGNDPVCPPGVACMRASGVILDAYTQGPVALATVRVYTPEFSHSYITGPNGVFNTGFVIPVSTGLRYDVSAPGYHDIFAASMTSALQLVSASRSVGAAQLLDVQISSMYQSSVQPNQAPYCVTRSVPAVNLRVYAPDARVGIDEPLHVRGRNEDLLVLDLPPGPYLMVGDTSSSEVGAFSRLTTVEAGRRLRVNLLGSSC